MSQNETPVILEAAINGMTSPEKNPNVPTDAEAIAAEALRCFELGAAIVHAHNQDIALTGAEAAESYLEAWRIVFAERPDALWYPTLTSAPTMADKLAHIEMIAREVPVSMCAFDPGSTNIGAPGPDGLPTGGVYAVSYDDVRTAFEFCERLRMGAGPRYLRAELAAHHARLATGGTAARRLDGEALFRRRLRPDRHRARGDLRTALRPSTVCSPTSTCSRARGSPGPYPSGAAT